MKPEFTPRPDNIIIHRAWGKDTKRKQTINDVNTLTHIRTYAPMEQRTIADALITALGPTGTPQKIEVDSRG